MCICYVKSIVRCFVTFYCFFCYCIYDFFFVFIVNIYIFKSPCPVISFCYCYCINNFTVCKEIDCDTFWSCSILVIIIFPCLASADVFLIIYVYKSFCLSVIYSCINNDFACCFITSFSINSCYVIIISFFCNCISCSDWKVWNINIISICQFHICCTIYNITCALNISTCIFYSVWVNICDTLCLSNTF